MDWEITQRTQFPSIHRQTPTRRARRSRTRFLPVLSSRWKSSPAEFGGKTSLIVKVSTRSGQGVTTPTGSLTTSYGSFGTTNASFDLAYGGPKWGNFIAIDGTNGGRFLDAPEFAVMHDKGNVENVFDRVDYQIATGDTLHLNLAWSRSWFQTPQTYDNLNLGVVDPFGNPVPAMDQRSQIKTYNISPSWSLLINPKT